MKLIYVSLLLLSGPLFASDHIDGGDTTKSRQADLSDLFAFPTPDKKDSLSVVLDTYPIMPESGHLSDKVSYQVVLRRAGIEGTGDQAGFKTSDEVTITCTMKTKGATDTHNMECRGPNGLVSDATFNKVEGEKAGTNFPLFAGQRSDPFFFDGIFAKKLSEEGKIIKPIPLPNGESNIMKHTNLTSIAMELDLKKLFPGKTPTMVAVAANSLNTSDALEGKKSCIDRVGRPEITNVSLVAHGNEDLRNAYNKDCSFAVSPENQKKTAARLNENIAFYDKVDEKKDWTDQKQQQLANILTQDFLVVDTSKPCNKQSGFLEIEKSILAGKPHATCGGRKPRDDIMDEMFTTYIGGLDAKTRISDNVDGPQSFTDGNGKLQEVSDTFPYLADPDLSTMGKFIAAKKRKVVGIADDEGGILSKIKEKIRDTFQPAEPENTDNSAPAN